MKRLQGAILIVELIALAIMANYFLQDARSCRSLAVPTRYTLIDGCAVEYQPGAWMKLADWNHFGKFLFGPAIRGLGAMTQDDDRLDAWMPAIQRIFEQQLRDAAFGLLSEKELLRKMADLAAAVAAARPTGFKMSTKTLDYMLADLKDRGMLVLNDSPAPNGLSMIHGIPIFIDESVEYRHVEPIYPIGRGPV